MKKIHMILDFVQVLLVGLVVASLLAFCVSAVMHLVTPRQHRFASPEAAAHCAECPGDDCPCISGAGKVWYISPETGDE